MTDKPEHTPPSDDSEGQQDPHQQSDFGRPLEDETGQPRYGVRLPEEERQAREQSFTAPSEGYTPPQYGNFTPHQHNPYGSAAPGQQPGWEYGVPPQQHHGNQQTPYNPHQPPTMPRPRNLTLAYRLILLAGGLFLAMNLFAAFQPNLGIPADVVAQLQVMYDDMNMGMDVAAMLEASRVPYIIMVVLISALYWLIARGVHQGSNVARIFGTIFAVISLMSLAGLGFLYVVPGLVGIVLTYVGPASEYFRYRAWQRVNKIQPPRG